MDKNNNDKSQDNFSPDEEIRKLVIARLQVMSPDTIKCVGNEGAFNRDELIKHVKEGDKIGETIEKVEMQWLRALKNGIISELYQ